MRIVHAATSTCPLCLLIFVYLCDTLLLLLLFSFHGSSLSFPPFTNLSLMYPFVRPSSFDHDSKIICTYGVPLSLSSSCASTQAGEVDGWGDLLVA